MRYLKPILLILLLCAAGLLFLRFMLPFHRDVNQGPSEKTEAAALDTKGNSPVLPAEKFQQLASRQVSPVVSPSRGQVNVDGLSTNLILAQRIEDLGGGKVRRLFVVNGGGTYPYHRIEELLSYDVAKGVYQVERQSMIVADHFLVQRQPGCTQVELEAFNASLGTRIISDSGLADTYIIQLPKASLDGVSQMMSVYEKNTNLIERVFVDSIDAPSTIPNETIWGSMWDKQRISCPTAWDWETGSTNIIIAIIDTGIDLDHPDLAAHLWHNPGEAGALATNGIDDDGNGYVDDWIGWDWGTGNGTIGSGDNNPDDNGDADHGGTFSAGGHGTHCAGIAGAIGNNSNQVMGVSWNVTIMALKPFEYMSDTKDMRVYASKALKAMIYATDKGAKVTSNSYGGPGSGSAYSAGISYQNSHGVLFVAAAGNEGTNNDMVAYEPAGVDLPNVLAVASSSYLANETLSSFSNYGSNTVDIVAPGEYIYSTTHDGNIGYKSGTSMATPEVAGAIALLYSYDPDLPYLTCKQMIMDGVDVFPAYSNKCVSHGRLNVAKSLDLLDAAFPDQDADKLPNKWEITYFGGTTNADPSATASNGVNTVLEAYIAGLNPTNSQSFFKATSTAATNGFVVSWDSVTGRVYGVYQATNLLSSGGFQALETNIVWPQSSYTDTVHDADSHSFYKINIRLAP